MNSISVSRAVVNRIPNRMETGKINAATAMYVYICYSRIQHLISEYACVKEMGL